MEYKGYEITAECNSWTQFEVIDEGETGAVIGTDFDDRIYYGYSQNENHIITDYCFSSLDDVKQAIDELEGK